MNKNHLMREISLVLGPRNHPRALVIVLEPRALVIVLGPRALVIVLVPRDIQIVLGPRDSKFDIPLIIGLFPRELIDPATQSINRFNMP